MMTLALVSGTPSPAEIEVLVAEAIDRGYNFGIRFAMISLATIIFGWLIGIAIGSLRK